MLWYHWCKYQIRRWKNVSVTAPVLKLYEWPSYFFNYYNDDDGVVVAAAVDAVVVVAAAAAAAAAAADFDCMVKTMLFMSCSVVDCGTPSTISNGDVIYSSTTYEADATYFCNDGYNMTNPAALVRFCTQYGYWSGSLPVCLCKSEYFDTDF